MTAVTSSPNLTFTPMSCSAEQSPVAQEAASPEKHTFQSAAPNHQRALSCQGQWRSRNTQRADEGEIICQFVSLLTQTTAIYPTQFLLKTEESQSVRETP